MKKTSSRGAFVAQDDLEVGSKYAIHGLKANPDEMTPINGMVFEIKAIQLPFLVGTIIAEPRHAPVTIDTRQWNIMRVTDEFAAAQIGDQRPNKENAILNSLAQRLGLGGQQ